MSDLAPLLRCQNLWKLYGPGETLVRTNPALTAEDAILKSGNTLAALRDVSLDVRKGEIFVIMGLSGSGKSTLVRCMTGLISATKGDLFIGEDNLRAIDAQKLIEIRRHKISMVFQDFALMPHLSVLENVAFPLRVHGIDRKTRNAKAREMIDLVGLSGREDHFPHELSGGQQQRVGIARSLTTNPDIWFLDEPFSALDPLIRHEMQDEFLRLQNALHKTIVFITHDFEEAIRLADRIAIMHDGRVVQLDTPERLVLAPADPYVAEFTRKIPRHRVLRIGSVMSAQIVAASGAPVPATALVADVAERVLSSDAPVAVVDGQGKVVGSIDRAMMIATIFGTGKA
jgi:glycine betaine/proline transport system ATP-binding protein